MTTSDGWIKKGGKNLQIRCKVPGCATTCPEFVVRKGLAPGASPATCRTCGAKFKLGTANDRQGQPPGGAGRASPNPFKAEMEQMRKKIQDLEAKASGSKDKDELIDDSKIKVPTHELEAFIKQGKANGWPVGEAEKQLADRKKTDLGKSTTLESARARVRRAEKELNTQFEKVGRMQEALKVIQEKLEAQSTELAAARRVEKEILAKEHAEKIGEPAKTAAGTSTPGKGIVINLSDCWENPEDNIEIIFGDRWEKMFGDYEWNSEEAAEYDKLIKGFGMQAGSAAKEHFSPVIEFVQAQVKLQKEFAARAAAKRRRTEEGPGPAEAPPGAAGQHGPGPGVEKDNKKDVASSSASSGPLGKTQAEQDKTKDVDFKEGAKILGSMQAKLAKDLEAGKVHEDEIKKAKGTLGLGLCS